ncbi:hypothetical protein CEXT_141 [Caerostris extrusa]|uniref:Uncharacterized protein n=1 Tax=Caerostris extrusa TaxID=172846 RepID=A0AAV4WMR1_CAEEX|nr:hypothetical protein CEXT_141 [Caerostris extrusa]
MDSPKNTTLSTLDTAGMPLKKKKKKQAPANQCQKGTQLLEHTGGKFTKEEQRKKEKKRETSKRTRVLELRDVLSETPIMCRGTLAEAN